MNGVSRASGPSSSEPWRMIGTCAGGGAHDSRRLSVVDNIMLRFRPIAPKPATCPGGSSDSNNIGKIIRSVSSSKGIVRKKRKYVRVRRNSVRVSKPINDAVLVQLEGGKRVTEVLQLLPDRRSSPLNRPMESDLNSASARVDQTVFVVVEAWPATCTTENDRDDQTVQGWVMSLEMDTCPGFLSDGSNSVTWVNGAFRKMVVGEGQNENEEVVVELVIKEEFSSFYCAFTGHVKLQYCYRASGVRVNKAYSRVVPFDLWRIDGGGFAWRLDVDSALTLGRT